MSKLRNTIDHINSRNEKALAVFITAGYPDKSSFSEIVLRTFDAGADIIEIGIPFSDPLADGPTIQKISQDVLQQNINLNYIFDQVKIIREKTDKPLVLMGYANNLMQFGLEKFNKSCLECNIDGIIVPDIPMEERDFLNPIASKIDKIFLVTPNSSEERIAELDRLSSGFLYCVSTLGTTGNKLKHSKENLDSLDRIYKLVEKNKTLIGFGISSSEDILTLKNYSDGFIVGSAYLKTIEKYGINEALNLIESLNDACK